MNLENDNLISVGIDIGTATTQIVFSRLVIKNTAGLFSIPKIEIVDKTIVYKSRIYFTPLIDDRIDILSVEKILEAEFRKSGFHKESIKSGAIIITGESARKENARKAVNFLSESAGNFVVAAAGSDLEAILAGKGSGAKEISEKRSKCVLNLDIGGGTTNACLFDSGKVVDTFALDIGGRIVKIKEDGTVIYVSDKIKPLIDANHYIIKEGFKTTFSQLSRLCDKFAEILTEACGFAPINEAFRSLFIGHLPCGKPSDIITFSGGVAECIYSDQETPVEMEDVSQEDVYNMAGNFPTMSDNHPFSSLWSFHIAHLHNVWCVMGRFATMPLKKSTVALSKLGLDENAEYAAFDFWEQKYLGTVKGSIECKSLCIGQCQIVALHKITGRPMLIASSRHVSMDAVSVLENTWNEQTLNLVLKGVADTTETYYIYLPKVFDTPLIVERNCDAAMERNNELLTLRVTFKDIEAGITLKL